LAVVEGGPIGCELTQAFCQFGSSVTLVGAAERIMLQDEPEAADVIAQRLVQDGVDLRTSAALQRVEKTATGVRLVLGDGGEVEAGAVLVSVGRRPQVEGLELEQAKVNHGPGGTQVNKKLRTSQPNIFAAGDCTGGYQFTHYAGYQGFTAGRDAFLPFRKKSVLHHPGQGETGNRHGPRKSPDLNYENDDEASQKRSATEGTNRNCIAVDSLEDGYGVNWGAGCVVQA